MSQAEYVQKIQTEIIPWIIEKNLSSHFNESLKSISSSLMYSAPEVSSGHIQDLFMVLNQNIETLKPIQSELADKLKEAEKLLK